MTSYMRKKQSEVKPITKAHQEAVTNMIRIQLRKGRSLSPPFIILGADLSLVSLGLTSSSLGDISERVAEDDILEGLSVLNSLNFSKVIQYRYFVSDF